MQANRTALALAALAYASGAFAQSTSTTMDMGGGMTHVDTMGPNGAMSSSNCMNMGGGMATCNTMDMSQPQRTYPTPDMSRPQRSYSPPEASEPEPSYLNPYASRLPMPTITAPPAPYVSQAVTAPVPVPPAAQDNRLIAQAPMSLVSAVLVPIPDWAKGGPRSSNSRGEQHNNTLYTIKYLGHELSIGGPEGLSIQDLKSKFDEAWRNDPWVEYSSTDAGTVYYFSITSEMVYADRIEVWAKADHSKNRTTKARMSKILYEVKCGDKTIRELLSFEYDAHGNVLSAFEYPGTAQRIIPETVGSSLHEEMCKIER
jgi:hypothetical protein